MLFFAKPSNRRANHVAKRLTESLEPRCLLAGDLVSHWSADSLNELENDSVIAVWTDQAGNLEAAATGSPLLVKDAINGRSALRLNPADGVDGVLLPANQSPLSGANDFSVSTVFRTSSSSLVGGNGNWFENTGLVDANQLGLGKDWGLSINSQGQISTGMSAGFNSPTTSIYSTATGLNDGQEHTVVITRSGSNLSIYVDGELSGSTDSADAGARTNEKLGIGMLRTETNGFDGEIADVRVFNGALSSEEVSTLHDELHSYYNNSPPVANDDTYSVAEDTIFFAVPASQGVLANDSDAEGDALNITLVETTQHGTLRLNDDGSFVYDSDNNFFGTDTFTYKVENFLSSNIATVTIEVTPVYDPVFVLPDNYKMRPNETLTVSAEEGITSNDLNVDSAVLDVQISTPISDGSLELNGDGSFSYDPQGFAGIATFSYQVHDGTRLSAATQVRIAVTTPPTANADVYTTNEDQNLIVSVADGVLANDTDPEGNSLTATLVSETENGSIGLQANGTFIYSPNEHFFGTDQFTYFTSDGFDDTEPTTVTINVTSVNDAPNSSSDAFFTTPGNPLSKTADLGLLRNDSDVEGTPLTAQLSSPAANGSVVVNADGSFEYTPNEGFAGNDSFTYIASDGTDSAGETEVFVGVSPQPFYISEFLATNIDTIRTRTRATVEDRFRGERLYPDWIEIQNSFDRDFDIGGLHLSDNADNLQKWQFPSGTIIPASGRIVVFASGLETPPELDESGFLHTNFRLTSQGEYLGLATEEGDVLSEFSPEFPQQLADISYGVTDSGLGYMLEPTPGEPNTGVSLSGIVDGPTIDTEHGFFTEPIQVSITNSDPDSIVRYTTDGSSPTADHGETYTGPFMIDKTSTVRAASVKEGFLDSRIDTRTYIYLADVLTQPDEQAPEGWPERWGSNDTDYGMDPDIVNDEVWGPQMIEALTQIPSMSIATDLDNLFDSRTGIYARASQDGQAAERPASLELLNPDGSIGFQHNIGLRIRGGFSRSTGNPKHAFRIFFNSIYGDGNLEFPLFADEGADSFAKVDLRTSQNYSWSFQNDGRNTFLRDIFSRDLQLAMGNQSTRGEFYHLYINGIYWGLFQTDERPEANFGASYYGGDPEDYDVVHNDPRANAATNGNTDAYRRLWEEVQQENGLSDTNMEAYYRVQGMNLDGTRNPDYERLLDVDNLIDYMVITYYTSDADGPGSKFTRPGLNNYFTVFNREDPDGFKFVEHDSEHSLDTGNAAGANYNMVTPLVNNGRSFGNFNPHYMHERLAETNSDYLMRFIDRVHELFQDDGLLGDANVEKMLNDRAGEIDMAIIAESARWGDSKRARPFTKTDWERAVRTTVNWASSRGRGAGRRSEVIDQLQRTDSRKLLSWYPSDETVAPEFSSEGGRVDAGFTFNVSATNGTIYVSTDGSDPRASGGGINASAIQLNSGDSITIDQATTVKARVLNGEEWSPITTSQFFVEPFADVNSLRLSEIHFNPAQPSAAEEELGFTDKDDFEFMEFVNISGTAIDLSSVQLEQTTIDGDNEGVIFDFSSGAITTLAPGERVLVVENLGAFQARYGNDLPVAGFWSGGLNNSSETITLTDSQGGMLQFAYSDSWHEATDGDGFSLEIVNERDANLENWAQQASWQASTILGGTPGQSSNSVVPGDSNGDGIFNNSDLILVFQAGEYEDGIAGNSTFQEGDWNGDGEFDSGDLVFVFEAGTYTEADVAAFIRSDFEGDESPNLGDTDRKKDAADVVFGEVNDETFLEDAFFDF